MRHTKSTIYALLILSIGIWGIVAYKVYSTIKGSKSSFISQSTCPPEKVNDDSVKLMLNYKDPFLGEYNFKKRKTIKMSLSRKKVIQTPKKDTPLVETPPDFQYKGMIRVGKNTLAIVFRKGESCIFVQKDKIGEFLIKKITDEKLITIRNGKQYDLLKQ